MIASIRGILSEQGKDYVVLENQGVGFQIFVTSRTAGQMPLQGTEVKLLTWLQVREDDMTLFGFMSAEEKNMFLKLIGVTGVGPRVALAILSGFSVSELIMAIVSEDSRAISRAQGVGKKTAERVILELKEKVDASGALETSSDFALPKAAESDTVRQAVQALMALGYSSVEASRAVSRVNKTGTVQEIITAALRGMDSGR